MKNKILLIGLLPFTLSMTAESTYKVTLGSSAYKDSVEVLEYVEDNSEEVVTPPAPSTPSSCKDILDSGNHTGNGVYTITNGSAYSVYCDMTTSGGGWTLVSAQFDSNPIGWNEGIQGDYDPTLSTGQSFTLNSSELPPHSQSTFFANEPNGNPSAKSTYFEYVYTTGQISKDVITDSVGSEHC